MPLPARRGAILDRDGVPLALTRETFGLAVAPNELRDRGEMAAQLSDALDLSRAAARRATDPKRKWVVLPGRFTAEQRRALGDARGLHWERRLERFYPQGRVGREVLGGVSGDGRALGGIEQSLDEMLRGAGRLLHPAPGRAGEGGGVRLAFPPWRPRTATTST